MDDKYVIPLEIDNPIPIFFWDAYEISIFFSIMTMFMVMDLMVFGLIFGVAALKVSAKLKKGAKRGQVQHSLYATGLDLDPVLMSYPSSTRRDFYN